MDNDVNRSLRSENFELMEVSEDSENGLAKENKHFHDLLNPNVYLKPTSSFYLCSSPDTPPMEVQVYQTELAREKSDDSDEDNPQNRILSFISSILGAKKKNNAKLDAGTDPDEPGKNEFPKKPPQAPHRALMFEDCGGLERQIGFLQTALLGPLRGENPNYERFGLEPPKGILFHGPPGTGKTRLAQAIGNEIQKVLKTEIHFIYRKGQDIASKWFGQSSENLRQVFNNAIANQPCVLFFDELDGLCPSRETPHINQENVSIVTTMLGLMDDLPRGKIFVIGATNRLETIDPSLRRPGRFDKYLHFELPGEHGRRSILKIHTNGWKVKPDEVILGAMSKRTVGFSGADLAKLCLDAFDNALSRVLGSSESFSSVDFSDLSVEEDDWLSALEKMKPSDSF